MSTNDEAPSKKTNNEDLLKSLRQLNSCITLTSVKETPPGSKSPSSEEDSSSDNEATGLPSALRGISIQGQSKDAQSLLNNLLGKKSKEGQEEENSEEERGEDGKEKSENSSSAKWINEWSKRCLSISFTSKNTPDEEESEEEEEEEDQNQEPDDVKGGSRLQNGSPSSSSHNSSSRDSLPDISKGAISIRPLSDSAAKSLSLSSVTVFKSKSQQKSQEQPPGVDGKDSSEFAPEREDEQQQPESDGPQSPRSLLKSFRINPEDSRRRSAASSKESCSPPSEEEPSFKCSFCSKAFHIHSDLISHIPKCTQLGCSLSLSSSSSVSALQKPSQASENVAVTSRPSQQPRSENVARKKTLKKPYGIRKLYCKRCNQNFISWPAFEAHHRQHITTAVRVPLKRCSPQLLSRVEGSEDSDSRGSSTGSSTGSTASHHQNSSGEDKRLKLTFKISSTQKRGRGHKRKTTVQIVSSQEMSERSEDRTEEGDYDGSQMGVNENGDPHQAPEQSDSVDENNRFEDVPSQGLAENEGRETGNSDTAGRDHDGMNPPSSTNFPSFSNNFGAGTSNERPPSTYQPQFESFPGDWFNEYDSGSRIAAAMTGATTDGAEHGERAQFNSENSSHESGYGTEDSRNRNSSPFTGSEGAEANKDLPASTSNQRDGLFSQEVLGRDTSSGAEETNQGSFEQLCLNDSFGQSQQDGTLSEQNLDPNYAHTQPYHNQQGHGSGGDILSELAYLNNGQQQMDPTRASPLEGERPFSSHSSNSGTPTSSGHPTPPPTDTSFRALATSPLNSPTSPLTSGGPTPPMQPGTTPPMPNSSSPLQQMGQMAQPHIPGQIGSQSQVSQDTVSAPRLTIANNLMPTTTTSCMGPLANSYGQQWASGSNSQQGFPSNYMQASTIPGAIGNSMANTIRPQVPTNLPIGYRPSPPPRIRGRPPLMGHVGRPPMMRGPGRPPGSTTLPPLMAAPGGSRGSMMPSLQRLPQYGAAQRQAMMGGQKRGAPGPAAGQSPNKTLRREDINVPSRQKDNECQIIAVANRVGDGMPVISNVQGGRDDRTRGSPATTSESTIHLSDSITLSVRSNSGGREGIRSEKGGDAGVVANLLASRGITVAPAAGEKEGSGNGGREERRLPTASDLNLSSAISVHPPTSRDRDGFAVPHPPSAKSSSSASVNSQVDRPPRPPTVDLTQEISTGGSQATRLACHQCDRTFPTQALLSDHAKIHQQQNQSRMPFKCHLCTAGFSTQKGQQQHYQQFHQLHLSAGDLAIPVVDFRNPANVQRMARLGIRSFLPLSNLQNRGSGGVVGIPVLTLENLHNGQMNLQQWGITDVLTLGPPRTMNVPR